MAHANKAERLMNLVMLLLSTRRPLNVQEIRERIPGYGDQTDDTFHRMFERDKAELREMELPLEQVESLYGDGYIIRPRDALLDDIGLTPDEQAALALAAQAWGHEASLGVLKLSAAAGVPGPGTPGWVLPRVAPDDQVSRAMDAVARRKHVTFRYRSSSGEMTDRTLEPHGIVHRGGWYLVGRDVGADDRRNFKLSRILGRLKVASGKQPDFDEPTEPLEWPRAPWEGEPEGVARIAFAPDAAWSAERRLGVEVVAERDDGWIELTMPYSDLPTLAAWLLGFADHAVVLEPPALRAAVVDRLRALAVRGT